MHRCKVMPERGMFSRQSVFIPDPPKSQHVEEYDDEEPEEPKAPKIIVPEKKDDGYLPGERLLQRINKESKKTRKKSKRKKMSMRRTENATERVASAMAKIIGEIN